MEQPLPKTRRRKDAAIPATKLERLMPAYLGLSAEERMLSSANVSITESD
jgi:hypothetical protein